MDHSKRFELLKSQLCDAIDVLQADGRPPQMVLPEMVKFTVALDLKANGPLATISALDGLLTQLREVFPQAALMDRPAAGNG